MKVLDKEFALTINGKLVPTEKTFSVYNPSNGSVLGQAPVATQEQLNEAVSAARAAFKTWSRTDIEERSQLLLQFAGKLQEHRDEMAELLALENGKPLSAGPINAYAEIDMSLYWFSEIAKMRLEPEKVDETDTHIVERHFSPLGVAGLITPWNFPVLLATWKIAPALIMGNTVVLKPSPYTPLTSLKMGEIAQEVFPPGVFNVVSGDDRLGQWMTEHEDIDKISFTGSSATGKKVMASASGTLKRLTLELGGNDAAIVMDDANVAEIVEPVFWSAFLNSAQVCFATKRLYVHEDIYDDLLAALVNYAKHIPMGGSFDENAVLGPIQNKMQYDKVTNLVEHTKQNLSSNIVLGGDIEEKDGYFIPITIVDNPPEDSRVVTEEAFGPILPVLKFNDYDELIDRVNNTPYGLAGSIWGKDIEKAKEIAKRIETGTVWINDAQQVSPKVPFGGAKNSGIGVEHSNEGLKSYASGTVIMVKK